MSQSASLDELMALAERLVPLAAVADRACEAMGAGRHNEAGLLLAQLRDANTPALCAETARVRILDNPAGQQLAQLLRSLTGKLLGANDLLNVWLSEPGAAVEAARYLTAGDWEKSTDLLVLIGQDLVTLARALLALGQKRVVVVAPGSESSASDASIHVVATMEALSDAAQAMVPPPMRVRFVQGRAPECTAALFSEARGVLEGALTDLHLLLNTVDKLGPVWVRQCIRNLPEVASRPSIARLANRFTGMPMVVAAAGPSLDAALPVLREHRDKLVLVVVSRSAAALSRAGIVPDFIMTADAADLTYHLSETPLDEVGALVLSVNAHPRMFEGSSQRILLYNANGGADAWALEAVNDSAGLSTGGSVSCNALSLGLALGCSPICFTGLDLAFRDGQMYAATASDGTSRIKLNASGTAYELEGRSAALLAIQHDLKSEGICQVEAVGGGPLLTSWSMNSFRRWFERIAKKLPAGQLINCSFGARIQGMEDRQLSDVVKTFAPLAVSPRSIIDEVVAGEDVVARRAAMRGWIARQHTSLLETRTLARQSRATARKATRAPGPHLQTLGTLEKQLTQRLAESHFVSLLAQKALRDAVQRIEAAQSLEASLAAGQRLYDIAEQAAEDVLEPLAEALGRLSEPPAGKP